MASIFIVDQSLTETGGHHFDYTRLVAGAAAQQGFDPVIGANRKLNSDAEEELSKFARVEKPFRDTTYNHLSHLAGLRELTSKQGSKDRKPDPAKGRLFNYLAHRARTKRVRDRCRVIRQFAEDCNTMFQSYSFEEDSHVLFTTISELEFMGLAAYLGNHPKSIQAQWHVQFHFSMFEGRPTEFAEQRHTEKMLTSAFQSALARIPYHNLKAYATSHELVEQYNRMKLMTFEPLPYPVNPAFFANNYSGRDNRPTIIPFDRPESVLGSDVEADLETSAEPIGPLRLAVAGGVRREKGQKTTVHQLINSLWDTHLATSKVRLSIQSGNPASFSSGRVMNSRKVDARKYRDIVQLHPHPLPADQYVDFIHDADVGLFCYDSRRYYSRRAGILSEFLACGKPVIVPAGSWLSQQLADSNFHHIERTIARATELQSVDVTDLKRNQSNVPLAGGIISFDQTRNPFHCRFDRHELNHDCSGLAIGFRWQWPSTPGCFAEIELTCHDAQDRQIGCDKQTVTCLNDDPRSLVFMRIPEGFAYGKLTFRNAFSESSISIADVEIDFLNFAGQAEPARSAVGVIAADLSMMTEAVDELVRHYGHYRESAANFSRIWASDHNPIRTIETLVPNQEHARRAA